MGGRSAGAPSPRTIYRPPATLVDKNRPRGPASPGVLISEDELLEDDFDAFLIPAIQIKIDSIQS